MRDYFKKEKSPLEQMQESLSEYSDPASIFLGEEEIPKFSFGRPAASAKVDFEPPSYNTVTRIKDEDEESFSSERAPSFDLGPEEAEAGHFGSDLPFSDEDPAHLVRRPLAIDDPEEDWMWEPADMVSLDTGGAYGGPLDVVNRSQEFDDEEYNDTADNFEVVPGYMTDDEVAEVAAGISGFDWNGLDDNDSDFLLPNKDIDPRKSTYPGSRSGRGRFHKPRNAGTETGLLLNTKLLTAADISELFSYGYSPITSELLRTIYQLANSIETIEAQPSTKVHESRVAQLKAMQLDLQKALSNFISNRALKPLEGTKSDSDESLKESNEVKNTNLNETLEASEWKIGDLEGVTLNGTSGLAIAQNPATSKMFVKGEDGRVFEVIRDATGTLKSVAVVWNPYFFDLEDIKDPEVKEAVLKLERY